MKTYLSFGGGVDTTAILLLPDVMEKIDFVIFADTGDEHPETYAYMQKYTIPYIQKLGIPFVRVTGRENVKGIETTHMEEAYLGWQMVPIRMQRHCTDKWKIRPMKKYIADTFPGEEMKVIIGFAYDERYRARDRHFGMQPWFPLIEKHLARNDCESIIRGHGWPVPPKSGCFYCPFQRLAEWKSLRYDHPDLWDRAVNLEKNGSNYPDTTISNFRKKGKPLTLEEVDRRLGNQTLDNWEEEWAECEGACFI